MAPPDRGPDDVRREIESERAELTRALETLRGSFRNATDVNAKLRSKLPAAAGAALALGFVFGGGIRATMRLLFRRGG